MQRFWFVIVLLVSPLHGGAAADATPLPEHAIRAGSGEQPAPFLRTSGGFSVPALLNASPTRIGGGGGASDALPRGIAPAPGACPLVINSGTPDCIPQRLSERLPYFPNAPPS